MFFRSPFSFPTNDDYHLYRSASCFCHVMLGLGILPACGERPSFFFTNAENFGVWAALICVTTSPLMKVWLFPVCLLILILHPSNTLVCIWFHELLCIFCRIISWKWSCWNVLGATLPSIEIVLVYIPISKNENVWVAKLSSTPWSMNVFSYMTVS